MKKIRAFTLVEFIIVITIIAIMATGFALSFTRSKKSATFNDYETQIVSILQKARGLSFSDLNVESIDVDHYDLDIQTTSVTLNAINSTGTTVELEKISLPSEYRINSAFHVYYTPPNGEVTINDGSNVRSFTFYTTDSAYSSTIVISTFGSGYPEIED